MAVTIKKEVVDSYIKVINCKDNTCEIFEAREIRKWVKECVYDKRNMFVYDLINGNYKLECEEDYKLIGLPSSDKEEIMEYFNMKK